MSETTEMAVMARYKKVAAPIQKAEEECLKRCRNQEEVERTATAFAELYAIALSEVRQQFLLSPLSYLDPALSGSNDREGK